MAELHRQESNRRGGLLQASNAMLNDIAQYAASVLYDHEATDGDAMGALARIYQVAKRGDK